MDRSWLLLSGMAIGLATWAVVLGMRLNPATDAARQLQAVNAVPRANVRSADQLYATSCASCHQAQGQGRFPVFPPLAGSSYVTGDAERLVSLTLHGMSGPMQVNGIEYAGLMPAFDHLDDEELARVLTHVRRSWGNDAGRLTAADVAKVRDASSARGTPWTAAELDAAFPATKASR